MPRQPNINDPSACGTCRTLRFVREFRSQRHELHYTLLNPNEARILGGGRGESEEVVRTILNARGDVSRRQEFSRLRGERCDVESV